MDGFHLRYRRRRTDRYEDFRSATQGGDGDSLSRDTRSLVVQGLEEHVEYEVFVQPHFGAVLGQPSNIGLVRTHQVSSGGGGWRGLRLRTVLFLKTYCLGLLNIVILPLWGIPQHPTIEMEAAYPDKG